MQTVNTKKTKYRLPAIILLIALCLQPLILPVHAEEPKTLYTSNAIVYNIEYATVMYEENADAPVYPAGTVKIMTALLTLEHYADTSATVTVTDAMVGSGSMFSVGETLTVKDLLAALIVSNSNDAASILACAIAGDSTAFVDKMNARAAELGMENTEYLNPTGIHHDRMTTTARDVLTLSCAAVKNQLYCDLAGSAVYTTSATDKSKERTLHNRNYFVSSYYNLNYYRESISGLSCSYTNEADTCLALLGTNPDGYRYITVVMGAEDPDEPKKGIDYACEDALSLMSWAYKAYDNFTVVGSGDMICEIPVSLSAGVDHVIALPSEKIMAFLPADTDLSTALRTEYTLSSASLTAPVSKGQVIGSLTAYVNDREIGTVDLIAKNNVDRSMWLLMRSKIVAFFKHPLVVTVIVAGMALVALYVFLTALRISRRNNKVRYKGKHK